MDDSTVVVRRKGGDSIINLRPKFSHNGQFILIPSAETIYSYNTKTGNKYIKYEGLTKPIIGFGIYFIDEVEHMAACGDDGVIIIWKLSDGLKIKNINIGKSVSDFIIRNEMAYLVSKVNHELKLFSVNLSSGKITDLKLQLPNIPGNYLLDIGGPINNQHIVIVCKNIIYFIKFTNKIVQKSIKKEKFTCIACNFENDCVLTGTSKGCVYVWQNITENPTMSKYHWHTLPVQTVQFSSQANMFYSGGDECVLVKWKLDKPLEKQFLPRLSSSIKQLLVPHDNSCLAVATADNAIHIVDPQFELICTIQHLVLAENYTTGIKFDPRTKCLVTNGIVGHLQFYSPHDSHLLYNLDVVGANKITDERDTKMINMDVSKVAMSRSGLWMATMEDRSDTYCGFSTFESRLKFWKFNRSNQTFELNTFVNYPHKAKVFDVEFQPMMNESALRCVTIGDDKYFRVWQLETNNVKNKQSITWRCASAAFYKELIPRSIAFSFDGSLLAVSFDHILTTWLPDSCELKCSLVHPIYGKPSDVIIGVAYGTGQQCHLLVSASKYRLSVWNLLTLTMTWTVAIEITHFVSELRSPYMAVFTAKKNLFVFNPSSSTPLYQHNNIKVLAAAFIPNMYVAHQNNWYHNTKLYFIDESKQLNCFESSDEETIETIQFVHEESSNPIFGQLPTQIKSAVTEHYKPVMHTYMKSGHKKKISDLLDCPAHTMPPIRLLCYSILSSMLLEEQKDDIVNDETVTEVTGSDILYKNDVKHLMYQNEVMFDEDIEEVSLEKITKSLTAAFI